MNLRKDHYRELALRGRSPTLCVCTSVASAESLVAVWLATPDHGPPGALFILNYPSRLSKHANKRKLSTTDLLVLASMKNAAKCDK